MNPAVTPELSLHTDPVGRMPTSFDQNLLACVEEVNSMLPRLHQRYTAYVLVSSLAAHLGAALELLLDRKILTAHSARAALERIDVMGREMPVPLLSQIEWQCGLRRHAAATVGGAGFEQQVRRCSAEIGATLPGLAARHSPWVLLATLITHVGAGLYACQEAGACTRDEARTVVTEIEHLISRKAKRSGGHSKRPRTAA